MIAWSPLQGGLLGGVVRKERDGHRRTSRPLQGGTREHIASRSTVRGLLSTSSGMSLPRWVWPGCWHQPAVTAPIVGPRTSDQLDVVGRRARRHLDDAALRQLDEIFPGHQTAPEDYAW
ncbi:MAG: aldo/keto reductase [Nocardioidaceae bacterium]